tara:strand:+ start:118 stop:615 length:498 start_codon:yes stop_codon:yes gene_type:complete
MGSIRGAHNVSNELGEVLISTSTGLDTTGWNGTTTGMIPQVAVAKRNYRILEVGYTATVTGTNGAAGGAFSIGTMGAGGTVVDSIVASTTVAPTLTAGDSISTSRGGANAISFRNAGDGVVDEEGIGRLESGNMIIVRATGDITSGPTAIFWVRLAPEIVRDFDN